MCMGYKLLLFDLDGTLLRNDKTISDNTLQVLKKCREKGMLLGVSTSRSEKTSRTFIEKLCPDILISSGGALVKYKDKYIYKAEYTKEETREMLLTARKICGMDCGITIDTVSDHYSNCNINSMQADQNWGASIYADFLDFSGCALKMCVEIFNQEKADRLQRALADCDCVRFSDGNWYKFTKKDVTKENAILKLCTESGISVEEIIAFGDDFADIGMLQLCGLGIAMGNAIDEVKEIADQVIDSNEEEGIARFLEEMQW